MSVLSLLVHVSVENNQNKFVFIELVLALHI